MSAQERLVRSSRRSRLACKAREPRVHRKKTKSYTARSSNALRCLEPSTKPRAVSDSEHALRLPHTLSEDSTRIPRITPSTLLEVLRGSYRSRYDRTKLIDCRFEYEYDGGHIRTAERSPGVEDCVDQLFLAGEAHKGPTLIVLYCEYSMYRAPTIARAIRERDRGENEENYPHLTYPELYILEGGYRSFFAAHLVGCTPGGYVSMEDSRFNAEREQGLDKLRGTRKRHRRVLSA